ncbi:MAG: nitroreductase [Desulfobacterales bacterium]|nr:nitroreductase [Desulfobacterales bacterium]
MNLIEAVRKRKSIRGFKPEPVPRGVIEQILENAVYAPSAMNTQPWEFTVLAGEVIDKIRNENIENLRAGVSGSPEHMTGQWPKDSVFRQRQVELAKQLFSLMGIEREDKEKRMEWMERGFRFFDAPAAVIISADRALGESGPLLDLGAVMQNICIIALEHGLGTCIEDQGILYPEVIRRYTDIGENKNIIIAIALGYPDPDFPANRVEAGRVSLSENTSWFGFD